MKLENIVPWGRNLSEYKVRVAKEVRIFPIITLEGKKSPHLHGIINTLEKEGYQVNIIKTEYEFQKGGDEMLRIRRR